MHGTRGLAVAGVGSATARHAAVQPGPVSWQMDFTVKNGDFVVFEWDITTKNAGFMVFEWDITRKNGDFMGFYGNYVVFF
jgi:Zn-dependent peptidase ImmA (M78 family)